MTRSWTELALGGEIHAGGHLAWTADSAWVTLAAIVAVAVTWAAVPGRGAAIGSWRLRAGELVAWTMGLAFAVIAVARPVWVEEEGRMEPGRVAVLIDASASMAVLEGGVARSEAVPAALAQLEGQRLELYRFGTTLEPGAPSTFDLPGTDVGAALAALHDRFAGEKLAAVVLISDGVDRGLLRRQFLDGENPPPPALPGPLSVVGVGKAGALRDLAVRAADTGGYAYLRTPFTITAELRGVGFERRAVPVELSLGGAIVRTEQVTLDAEGRGEVRFEVTPDRAGRFAYLVQVPDFEGDAVPGNNALPVVVRVVRDKLRILQVAGSPSWDVKFLRRFLKGDPSVDLVSFFILRTTEDLSRGADPDELSLIQFPYEELFQDELLGFDLVVFQNFDYKPYFQRGEQELLDNLRRYVTESGHGFVMVGGDRSFSLGDYGGTPIADILPVALPSGDAPPSLPPFQPALTEPGARHPITRLATDVAENQAWWSRLHAMDGTNIVGDATPDAAVLLSHPSLTTPSGKPMPVLSVREVGAGRTMALTVDTSWRWSLSEAAAGRGNQAYLRFWKNAFRWLAGDPTVDRLTVEAGRENYSPGEEVKLVARVRGPDFAPLADTVVEFAVTHDGVVARSQGVSDKAGEAVVTVPASARGAHAVTATVGAGESQLVAASVFAVTNRDPELDEVVPDPAFLAWLAERGGGAYAPSGAPLPVVLDPSAGREVRDRREVALWRAPALVLLTALPMGVAWWLRRRAGLR